MELKRVIERLENYQQWRRDQNVPPKVEMQSPIEIGAAIDYAISELKKLLLSGVRQRFHYYFDWKSFNIGFGFCKTTEISGWRYMLSFDLGFFSCWIYFVRL